jgi:hypothetical protein
MDSYPNENSGGFRMPRGGGQRRADDSNLRALERASSHRRNGQVRIMGDRYQRAAFRPDVGVASIGRPRPGRRPRTRPPVRAGVPSRASSRMPARRSTRATRHTVPRQGPPPSRGRGSASTGSAVQGVVLCQPYTLAPNSKVAARRVTPGGRVIIGDPLVVPCTSLTSAPELIAPASSAG